jgi:hypothetical protein
VPIVARQFPDELTDACERELRVVLRCKLPFRLRVQGILHVHRPGTSQHAYLLNREQVSSQTQIYRRTYAPPSADGERVLKSRVLGMPKGHCTDVLLISKPQRLKPEAPVVLADEDRRRRELPALTRLLNGLLVAYCVATGDRHGIFPYRLYQVDALEEIANLTFYVTSRPGRELTDDDAMGMFRESKTSPPPPPTMVGFDLPPEQLKKDLTRSFDLHEREIFYQFEIEAGLSAADPARRLLLACIALEAAHAAMLRSRIAKRDPALNTEQAVSDLLIGGFMRTVVLTPSLVMEPDERPSQELIERAMKGVIARNDIMHAVRKRGEYKIASFDNARLRQLGDDVLALLEVFRKAVEKDAEQEAMV